MSADLLLSKLEKVRQTGPGTWKACCPSHDDKSPSLSIREVDDGKVLLVCFAGCGAAEVVAAVGLTLSDLFPPTPIMDRTDAIRGGKYQYRGGGYSTQVRRPFSASPWGILECVADESLIVCLCSSMLQDGQTLSPEVHDRLILARSRIERGRELVNGEFSADRARTGATYCDALTVAKADTVSGGSHVGA